MSSTCMYIIIIHKYKGLLTNIGWLVRIFWFVKNIYPRRMHGIPVVPLGEYFQSDKFCSPQYYYGESMVIYIRVIACPMSHSVTM